MDSPDLQLQHQLQQQQYFKVPKSQDYHCNSNILLDHGNYSYMSDNNISISRSRSKELLFQESFIQQQSPPMSDSDFPKLSEIMICNNNYPLTCHGENLWLSNFSSEDHHHHDMSSTELQLQLSAGDDHDQVCPNTQNQNPASRYNLSNIFPSSIISSNSDFCTTTSYSSSSSSWFNLQASDLLTSTYHDHTHTHTHGGISTSSTNSIGKLLSGDLFMGHDDGIRDMSPSNSSNKMPLALENGVTKAKRPGSFKETTWTDESHQETKKHRSRSLCPPMKVRKEKLGDRIASLQKLVSPFGKTDTASVLTEAIGYIQFLHDQVHTLSVPANYMNASHNHLHRKMQTAGISSKEDGDHQEPKKDLRRRGLCLVPLSAASYFDTYSL